METIDLNDLPRWSKWPARLLGFAPWSVPSRTIDKIDQEYDNDKYLKCLRHWEELGPTATFEQLKDFELGMGTAERVCFSDKDGLKITSLADAWSQYCQLLVDRLGPDTARAATVVELGAGYGYNGYLLSRESANMRFLGGDYSPNAVVLAARLFERHRLGNHREVEFNFYEPATYDRLLDLAEPPVLVFTAGAVEQVPAAGVIIDNLRRHRERIAAVLHFEPAYELHDDSLLGLMRRRYAEVNDYNRDLLSVLRSRPDIHITHALPDVFGLPPLNPISIIRWEFAS
jgi:hypothetical protein